jgi:hypothetical protein
MDGTSGRGAGRPRSPWTILRRFRRAGSGAVYDRYATGQVKMRQIRSADPWSTFLAPPGRTAGARPPAAPDAPGAPHARGDGDDAGTGHAGDAYGRVLGHLRSAKGPLSLEEIRHATRLGPLEVADAVETLRERGLVSVEREIDEVVRLTGR